MGKTLFWVSDAVRFAEQAMKTALKSEKHASKFFGCSKSYSNEEECGSAGKVH